MTINDTAPIQGLDRLLDDLARGGDGRTEAGAAWLPLVERLERLDAELVPEPGLRGQIWDRLTAAEAAPPCAALIAPSSDLPARGEPPAPLLSWWTAWVAAAAAIILVAGVVWTVVRQAGEGTAGPAVAPPPVVADLPSTYGREEGRAPETQPARNGSEPRENFAQPAGDATAKSRPPVVGGGATALDQAVTGFARASYPGLGSASLAGLAVLGAEAGRQRLVEHQSEMLEELEAAESLLRQRLGLEPAGERERFDGRSTSV